MICIETDLSLDTKRNPQWCSFTMVGIEYIHGKKQLKYWNVKQPCMVMRKIVFVFMEFNLALSTPGQPLPLPVPTSIYAS